MDKKFLESSEFYSARFNNFSTLVIAPIALLLFGLLIFSFFAQREITINGTGTIEPLNTVTSIQATVNSAVTHNYLEEGKYVHQGQILLRYSNLSNQSKLHLYQSQKKNLLGQLDSLNLLKQGITLNKDAPILVFGTQIFRHLCTKY